MADQPAGAVTQMLRAASAGDARAAADLLPLVYTELRKLAQARMAKTPPGNTLQPTALVHEAFLRLIGRDDPSWNSRGHFFAAAAQAMRREIWKRLVPTKMPIAGDVDLETLCTADLSGGELGPI